MQAQHDRLGFRVAEAAVEFDDLRIAGFVDHQSGIQEAGVDIAFLGHAAHSRPDHQIHHALVNLGGDHRSRRVSSHAAGVRAAVAVADALVVLAGGHWQDVLAIDHDNEAGFFAIEKLFDHHP